MTEPDRPSASRAERFVTQYVTWRDHSAEEEAEFDRYARRYCVRAAQKFCLAFVAFLPVYYLVDLASFGPGAALRDSAQWRLGAGALLTLGALGARVMQVTGRDAWAYPLGISGGAGICAVIGVTTSASAPLGSVTTSAFLLLPLCAVPMVSRLWVRCVATTLAAAGVLGGYFLSSAARRDEPSAAYFVSVMAFTCVLSLGIGHALSQLVRQAYFLARQLAHDAHVLEDRVRARTEEIRELLAQVVEAREDERTRISREVHDELGQLLGGVALSLDRARTLHDRVEQAAELARSRDLVARAMDATRTVVTALRPRLLDDMDLASAIEWLVRHHEDDTGADCAWSIELDPARMSPTQTTVVFRVLQEALTNCARHARAGNVSIVLDGDDAGISLTVRDDGVGFAPASTGRRSFGLRGMHERARTLGGRLTVESEPGAGTRVSLRLPWVAADG